MKLETKQTEIRLVAESDIDKFYLDNWFNEKKRLFIEKEYEDLTDECFKVVLTKERQ